MCYPAEFKTIYCLLVTMSKFWGFVGTIVLVALTLIAFSDPVDQGMDAGITFTDLETECRNNQGQASEITLHQTRDSIKFDGQFRINNTNSDLTYDYSLEGNKIILNVIPEKLDRPESYADACLALVKYQANTADLEEGSYTIELRHDGKLANKKIIRIG